MIKFGGGLLGGAMCALRSLRRTTTAGRAQRAEKRGERTPNTRAPGGAGIQPTAPSWPRKRTRVAPTATVSAAAHLFPACFFKRAQTPARSRPIVSRTRGPLAQPPPRSTARGHSLLYLPPSYNAPPALPASPCIPPAHASTNRSAGGFRKLDGSTFRQDPVAGHAPAPRACASLRSLPDRKPNTTRGQKILVVHVYSRFSVILSFACIFLRQIPSRTLRFTPPQRTPFTLHCPFGPSCYLESLPPSYTVI